MGQLLFAIPQREDPRGTPQASAWRCTFSHSPNILPVLQEIGLLKPRWGYFLDSDASVDPASMVNAFQPFVVSRQQAGHSVTVTWQVFSNQS
jgi:hypothetical protein